MTGNHDQLRDAIRRVFPDSTFETVSLTKLSELRDRHSSVPDHYLEFLREIGWGSLGEMGFMFYGGPVNPVEIYGPDSKDRLDGILLIGDDFAGWCLGMDTQDDWRLVGIEPRLDPYPLAERTLSEFVRGLIAQEMKTQS